MRYVQFLDSLGFNRGGLTRAVYERLSIVPESCEVVIAVTGFQADVRAVFERLKESGDLPARAELRAFHEENFELGAWDAPAERGFGLADARVVESGKLGRTVRYFRRGEFMGLEWYDSSGVLRSSDHHATDRPHQIDSRRIYDVRGRLVSQTWFDDQWRGRYIVYYRRDGSAFCAAWLRDGGRWYRVIRFGDHGAVEVRSLNGLRVGWVEDLLAERPGSVAFSDEPSTIFALSDVRRTSQTRGVAVIHTVHFANNTDAASGYRGWMSGYVRGRGALEYLVTCTEAQRRDLLGVNGWEEASVVAIPHAAPESEAGDVSVDRRFRVLVLSRLHIDKRIDLAMKAFAHAWEREPRLSLDIVGDGPERASLEALARSLPCASSIHFHGWTSDSSAWFARSGCQFFTSKYEGFGLTLLEGFATGCPAVAIDVPYGPRELVVPGVSGVLVEGESGEVLTESLGEALLRVVGDLDSWQEFSDASRRFAADYSREVWHARWVRMIEGSGPQS